MRIFDASWINHEGSSIFSVDIHPNGRKLATAGQDQSGAGLLVIWPINFIFEKDFSKIDSENYGFLSRIPYSKSINCVRWCKDGRRLVCAGDDPVICVYECVGNFTSMGTLGSKSTKSKTLENYRCIHMLYGHSMDILHVDFSPDSKYLASCSLDNSIIVWNAERFPEKIVVLKHSNGGHTRGVKGLSWDPVGRFLSTQAEDNSLKLWQTDSWECVKTITEPYQEATSSTLFLRMDWSPDGSYLVCPGAMNNGGPTANIVTRKDWSHKRDFVGFRKAVSCVRANPRCFYRQNSAGFRTTVSCFATGCRNRSLVVWVIPSFGRPIIVLDKIFKLSVLDLSWNDMILAACSNDGSVKLIHFNESELGERLSSGEMVSLSEKVYGFLPEIYKTSNNSAQNTLLNDNFVYSVWNKFVKNKSLANNIFQKRKFSSFDLERIVLREKRQKMDMMILNDYELNDDDQLLLKPLAELDRRILERCFDNVEQVFKLEQNRRQLITKTVQWQIESRVKKVEVLNEFCMDEAGDNKNIEENNVTRICAYGNALLNDCNKQIWSIFTSHIVSHIASNSFWTCFTTFSGRFVCHSTPTSRLIFSAVIDGPACSLLLNGHLCLIILCCGKVLQWNISSGVCNVSDVSGLFNNKAQHLWLNMEPELKAILSDYNCFCALDSNNKEGEKSMVWKSTQGISTLFRDFNHPLSNFSSFTVLKNIVPNLNSLLRMLPTSSKSSNSNDKIEITQNKCDESFLFELLETAIYQKSESEALFIASVLALRFLRRDDLLELNKFVEGLNERKTQLCEKLNRHIIFFIDEYLEKKKLHNLRLNTSG